jgi:hypothetical protein
MMRFLTFIKTIGIIATISGLCFPQDATFISVAGDCRYPTVTSEGSDIYMVWQVVEGKPSKLYFRRSPDEGATWTAPEMISNENSESYPPAMAVHSGIIHVSWIDFSEIIDGKIFYARSLDSGKTWLKNVVLVPNANSARYPLLACKDSNVYLVWQDVENQVFFKVSTDLGTTWSDITLLGKVGKHSCYCFPPAISVGDNELMVVWTDFREDLRGFKKLFNRNSTGKTIDKMSPSQPRRTAKMISSVVCRKSTDNGKTWRKEQILSATRVLTETRDEIDNPAILSDGTRTSLFWLDKRNLPLGEIFFARFDPETAKLPLTGKNLYTTLKRSPKRPSVVFDNKNNIYMSWTTFLGGKSIVQFGAIDSTGNPVREKTDITTVIGRYHNPVITRTSSGILYIFWFDEPKDKDEWSKIFLKTSRDNGMTWENWEPLEKDR